MAERTDPSKTKRTYLVISQARCKFWMAAAKREDRTLSSWLRLAADDAAAADEPLPAPRALPDARTPPQEIRVHFRVTEDQKARWKAAAKREERPLGNWLKLAGDARAKMKPAELLARARRAKRRAAKQAPPKR